MNSSIKFVVSHPTGNNFVKALLEQLEQKKQLEKFFTTIGIGEDSNILNNFFFKKRHYSIPDSKITRKYFHELIRLLSKGTQLRKRIMTDNSYFFLDNFVSKKICKSGANVLHAYEDGALASFKAAKEVGIKCSYELPIAYWITVRKLLKEEAERYPDWIPTLESQYEPEEKLYRKEKEIGLADRITCPSKFVLESIPSAVRDKIPCQVAGFGSPFASTIIPKKKKNTLKILFVGSMSQRKGLADLFAAMKLLKNEPISLSILGQPSMPIEFYREKINEFNYYPPCSNKKVREIMKEHDALILPSIIEGRALVQQEALSCGLPIIVTPNAGGEDLIEKGITGYIVPIRSPNKIAESVLDLFEKRKSINDIKEHCIRKSSEYSWTDYANKIINFSL